MDHLTQRVVESELRTATAITDLAGTMRDMTAVLRSSADLRPRVEKCELPSDPLWHEPGEGIGALEDVHQLG
jgi:hypothetical protein